MKREYADYVSDILDSIQKIERFRGRMTLAEFKNDEKTIFATVHALEIIGEASKNIPNQVKQKNPQIPWKAIAGMRDKLVHEYFGADLDIVWKTINEDIPPLQPLFEKILKACAKRP